MFGVIGAVVESSFEELDSDDGEDELKQHVDDHYVEHVLERVDHTVEHRLSQPSTPLVYRCLHGLAPLYLSDYFERVVDTNRRRLRSSSSSLLAVRRTRLLSLIHI